MKKSASLSLGLIFLVDGFIWLQSGVGKISSSKFVDGLAGTLTKFSGGNPYPWFKDFLTGMAIPNAWFIGWGVQLGEILAGVTALAAGVILLSGKKVGGIVRVALGVGFLAGAILNGLFWLAAAWTSPSTDSLNLIMAAVGVSGLLWSLRFSKD